MDLTPNALAIICPTELAFSSGQQSVSCSRFAVTSATGPELLMSSLSTRAAYLRRPPA